MRCRHCNQEIPEAFWVAWKQGPEAKTGRFACPHCQTEHIRRELPPLPTGELQFTIRLWGHPSTTKRRKPKP